MENEIKGSEIEVGRRARRHRRYHRRRRADAGTAGARRNGAALRWRERTRRYSSAPIDFFTRATSSGEALVILETSAWVCCQLSGLMSRFRFWASARKAGSFM